MKRVNVLIMITIAVAGLMLQSCFPGRCKDCGKVVKVTVLRGVHFDFDKSELKPSAFPVLNQDVALLKEDSSLDILIEGHCDIKGSDAYNLGLSDRRANTVYNYFLQNGIAPNRMSTIGLGKRKPIVPNDTEENRALNRRVEIKIIKARPS